MKRFSAFTLAEVLITLGIIGVVAALTLPNLIANHQKKVLSVRAKKVYSTLYQGFNSAIYKNGEPEDWESTSYNSYKSTFFDYYIFPELQGTRCRDNNGLEAKARNYMQKLNEYGVRNSHNISSYWCNCFMTNSGEFIVTSQLSSQSMFSAEEFLIDVNGFQKPNQYGKDIFAFFLVNKAKNSRLNLSINAGQIMGVEKPGIYPAGYQGYGEYFCKNSIDWTCPYKLMQDGWEFKDDYPWK